MKIQWTRQFKIIQPNKHKELALNLTMRRYKKCINYYLYHIARDKPMKDIYNECKALYDLTTGLIQTCRDIAKEQYDSYNNNPNNHTFPHFRGLMTVRYDHRTITFQESDGHFGLWASISTVNGKVRVPITSCNKYIKELLNNRFKAVQLIYKDSEYYLNIIFEYERKIPKETEFQHFIGIDRGSHNNVATVVVQDRNGTVLESKFYSAKPILEKRRRFYKLRRALGKKKLLKMIKKSRGREQNYVNDQLHKITTDIIKITTKYSNAVIVLENLKGIRERMKWSKKQNRKGHSWAFKKLEEMLIYKAHGNSIAIRRVYPRGTSSTCNDCLGHIKRSPSILAVCISCKKTLNADWLGAVNITRRLFYYMLNSLGRSESGPEQSSNEPTAEGTAPDINRCLVAQLVVS